MPTIDIHLTNHQFLVLGTAFALIAAFAAVAAVIVPIVFRFRDRRAVAITNARVHDDRLVVRFRNSGGSPTVVNGIRFVVLDGPPPDLATIGGNGIKLAGRDDGEIRYKPQDLRGQCPDGERIGIAAVEDSGKVSKAFELDRVAIDWLRAQRPTLE